MSTTANQNTAAITTQLQPYIFFYGRAEEALAFYKSIFGGAYEIARNSDLGMSDHVSPDFKDKVGHATFKSPAISFMAADGREAKAIDPDAGNISLALSLTDRAEGGRIFDALAKGGNVMQPFGDASWGGQFGALTDRFGTEWLITAP